MHESKFVRARAPEDVAVHGAWAAGEYEEGIEAARRLIAVHEEFGIGAHEPELFLGAALSGTARHAEAVTVLREAVRTAEATTTFGWTGELRQLLARAELAAGDLAAARASAELAYREIDASDAFSRATTATTLALVRAAEGDLAEADRLHREAVAVNGPTGYQFVATEARQSYAEFLLACGRAAEARPLLERVRDFYAHPFVAKRRARAEELLRRCDEIAAR